MVSGKNDDQQTNRTSQSATGVVKTQSSAKK